MTGHIKYKGKLYSPVVGCATVSGEIEDVDANLEKAVGALRIADEYLEYLAFYTNALDKQGERYLMWRKSTDATKYLGEAR